MGPETDKRATLSFSDALIEAIDPARWHASYIRYDLECNAYADGWTSDQLVLRLLYACTIIDARTQDTRNA